MAEVTQHLSINLETITWVSDSKSVLFPLPLAWSRGCPQVEASKHINGQALGVSTSGQGRTTGIESLPCSKSGVELDSRPGKAKAGTLGTG